MNEIKFQNEKKYRLNEGNASYTTTHSNNSNDNNDDSIEYIIYSIDLPFQLPVFVPQTSLD
jgi:hypothetical protein